MHLRRALNECIHLMLVIAKKPKTLFIYPLFLWNFHKIRQLT